MAVLAVLIPSLMLGVVLMLGRYEELLLPVPPERAPDGLAPPGDAGTRAGATLAAPAVRAGPGRVPGGS
ncbi:MULTISPECIES: hypothetical protein [unclassified Streptomyces]|uniref:hypothetical protein n=1 Tax=unclassified Streptomyces TaxID=2593676 RepID=UPI0005A8C418|nr:MULTISPECIES: hypothetical protein [unclassified Streptomyces]ODA74888.1 hypothetical protein APS67_001077 [Streptomyces sp. AVP053U2]